MNVRELRDRLVAFDDEMRIFVAPTISADCLGEPSGVGQMDIPHPVKHYPIRELHVLGDLDANDFPVDERYIVLRYADNGSSS